MKTAHEMASSVEIEHRPEAQVVSASRYAGSRVRRALRWTVRRLVFVLLGVVAMVSVPSAAHAESDSTVTIDGTDVVVAAHYSCATDSVEVRPTSITPLDGNWPVWMAGSVFDTRTQQWLHSPQWYQADGITALTFPVDTEPGPYAVVYYAVKNQSGQWDQTSTRVQIQDDLENSAVFCQ